MFSSLCNLRNAGITLIVVVSTTLTGCAAHASHDCALHHPPAEHGDHASHASGSSPGSQGPAKTVQVIEIPASAGADSPRQMSMLTQNPAFKVAALRLKAGATLPEHTSPAWVVIEAIDGAATVTVGEERARVDKTHIVTLAPKAAHSVVADGSGDALLLVHQIGAPAAP